MISELNYLAHECYQGVWCDLINTNNCEFLECGE